MISALWWSGLLMILVILLGTGYFKGPHIALAAATLVSFTFPRWIKFHIFGEGLDMVVASGILSLGYYCFHPKARFRTKLIPLDFAMIGIVTIHFASDWKNESLSWILPLRIYGEWFVPYVLGRLALGNGIEWKQFLGVAAGCATVLSAASLFESIMRTNAFEYLLVLRESLAPKYMLRFGFQRAFGPTENPIYFGVVLFLLLPWSTFFALQNARDSNHWWKFLVPLIHFAGILGTLSRAPILAVGFLIVVPISLLYRRLSIPIGILSVLIGLALFMNWGSTVERLQVLGGERLDLPRSKILLDGQEVNYSTTEHRVLLWRLYKTAVERTGILGFGTDRTSVFPPRVPMGGENDINAVKRLWCIDNYYLLILLRFGYAGLTCWCVVLGLAIGSLAWLSRQSREGRILYALLCGTVIGIALIQVTVWMPHDYGFVLLWTLGLTAGAACLTDSLKQRIETPEDWLRLKKMA